MALLDELARQAGAVGTDAAGNPIGPDGNPIQQLAAAPDDSAAFGHVDPAGNPIDTTAMNPVPHPLGLPEQIAWLDSPAGHPLFPNKTWSQLQNDQIISIPQVANAMNVADHILHTGHDPFAPAPPPLPQEVLNNPPPNWGGVAPADMQFGPGQKYESPEAYRLSDWQANLQDAYAHQRGGEPNAIDYIPRELLDKYWPIHDVGGVLTPTVGDPMGGWNFDTPYYTDYNTVRQIYPEGGPKPPMGVPTMGAGYFGQSQSTGNWRMLPPGFQDPNFTLQNGTIVDRRRTGSGYWPGMGSTASGATGLQYGGSSAGLAPVGIASWHQALGEFWPGAVYGPSFLYRRVQE